MAPLGGGARPHAAGAHGGTAGRCLRARWLPTPAGHQLRGWPPALGGSSRRGAAAGRAGAQQVGGRPWGLCRGKGRSHGCHGSGLLALARGLRPQDWRVAPGRAPALRTGGDAALPPLQRCPRPQLQFLAARFGCAAAVRLCVHGPEHCGLPCGPGDCGRLADAAPPGPLGSCAERCSSGQPRTIRRARRRGNAAPRRLPRRPEPLRAGVGAGQRRGERPARGTPAEPWWRMGWALRTSC
mmetsp:Transcript_30311/g.94850  ORF Transcript_30311/g.94850 Transcript_30311/m.94850 type:complete len:240 (-) Transcript_30311:1656-2375(-)